MIRLAQIEAPCTSDSFIPGGRDGDRPLCDRVPNAVTTDRTALSSDRDLLTTHEASSASIAKGPMMTSMGKAERPVPYIESEPRNSRR